MRFKLDGAKATLGTIDEAARRLARTATTWAPWPFLIGIAVGAGIWGHRHPSRLSLLETNKLTEPERHWMLASLGGATLGVWLLVLLVALWRRRRTGRWDLLGTIGWLNPYLIPLIALPITSTLRLPNIEKDSTKGVLFLIAVAAVLAGYGVYGWGAGRTAADDEAPEPLWRAELATFGRRLAPVALVALWAGYAAFFSRLSITNHQALNTRTTDLGYYDNIFYQSIHGRPLACTFIKAGYHGSAHFDPLLVLLSPIYLIYSRAELLLVFQSLWLGAGVIPVYLLAHAKLASRGKALLLSLIWALYPAMHGANMYEFHSLTLLSPLVVWLLYFYETGKTKFYWALLPFLLLCREDVSLLMCFVGLYALLDPRGGRTRMGWVTIVVSLTYFVIAKVFFMTSAGIFMSGKDAYSYAYYYEAMIPNKSGLGGLVVSLVTNPVFTLRHMLSEPKVIFLLQLFLPLAFIPFFARSGRWMLGYGLLFCLLASRDAVFTIHFQYSSVIFSIAFALTPLALKQVEDGSAPALLGIDGRRLSRALLGAALVASALTSWKFGGLVDNAIFRGGFSRVTRNLTPQQRDTYAWVREQVAKIPPGASVGATNKMGTHISNRKEAYFYPGERATTVQYVLLDESELKGRDLEQHTNLVKRGALEELGRLGKMALFQQVVRPPSPPGAPPPSPAASSSATPDGVNLAPVNPPRLMIDGGAPPAPLGTPPEEEPQQDEDPTPGP